MEGDSRQPFLDYSRLDRFLDSRGASDACPICGHDRWNAIGPLGNNGLFLQGTDANGEILSAPGGDRAGLEVYGLGCANCGFIRLHNARQVNEQAPNEDKH